jgi:hypothetical protein
MPRHITRPARAYMPLECEDVWNTDPMLPAVSVDDHEAVFTGLLDAKGEEVWRAPNPMGFGRDGEW